MAGKTMNGDQRNGKGNGCERAGKEGKETFNETVLHFRLDNIFVQRLYNMLMDILSF